MMISSRIFKTITEIGYFLYIKNSSKEIKCAIQNYSGLKLTFFFIILKIKFFLAGTLVFIKRHQSY